MRKFIIIAAALSLAACSGEKVVEEPKADAPDAAAAPADAAAPATAAATPAKGAAPTKEFIVGKWAEKGDCGTMAIEFKADGSMVGPADKWELNGNALTFVGMPQKMMLTVVDEKTMESRLDGKEPADILTRC